MKIQNYYKILDLSQDSSIESLNEKCRELFIKYHPNNNKTKEGNTKFMLVNDAYAVLLKEDIRKDYDYLLSKYSEEKPVDLIDRQAFKKITDLLARKRNSIKKTISEDDSFPDSLLGGLSSDFSDF